jgi:hypothetical protein
VVLVEQNPVVVLATSVTTTARMATMLSDTTVTAAHLSASLAVLRESGRLKQATREKRE